jgi:hypothetical protein
LRHLSESRVNATVAGPVVAKFRIPEGDIRVLWGPIGSKEPNEPTLTTIEADDALARIEEGGAYVVFNPAAIRHRLNVLLTTRDPKLVERESLRERRSA